AAGHVVGVPLREGVKRRTVGETRLGTKRQQQRQRRSKTDHADYSAASFTEGAAALMSGVAWLSYFAKFFWNIAASSRAVLSNSALSFQVLNGSNRCGSTPDTEVGTEKPK